MKRVENRAESPLAAPGPGTRPAAPGSAGALTRRGSLGSPRSAASAKPARPSAWVAPALPAPHRGAEGTPASGAAQGEGDVQSHVAAAVGSTPALPCCIRPVWAPGPSSAACSDCVVQLPFRLKLYPLSKPGHIHRLSLLGPSDLSALSRQTEGKYVPDVLMFPESTLKNKDVSDFIFSCPAYKRLSL